MDQPEIMQENYLTVTDYQVLGELPDPFVFENGEPVKGPEDWPKRREEIYRSAIELQYGTQPPAPEFLETETLYRGGAHRSYLIHTGTRQNPVTIPMKVILPEGNGPCPVIVDGDLCFGYAFDKAFLDAALSRGIGWVLFDRTVLAHDLQGEGRRQGALYRTYPDHTFGALGAWAWGYSRCVDALEQLALPRVDLSCITFSGHSRGGKTAALAGALDPRAAIVNPNETCAGSCGCYRIHIKGFGPGDREFRSETLRDLWNNFGFWLGPDMEQYADREQELPFDTHFLKAMIAPRTLFVSEAAADLWANPVGSWMTSLAAKRVFDFLNVPDNLLWYFRPGHHYHTAGDVAMLCGIIRNRCFGEPLPDGLFRKPFPDYDKIFRF